MEGEGLAGRGFVGVFVGEGMTETLSLLRRRTRAVRWVPRDFPRIEDQPEFSTKLSRSSRDSPSPRLAPDM